MTGTVFLLLAACVYAGLGMLWMRWLVSRFLPVPKGPMMRLKFLLMWTLSILVGTSVWLYPFILALPWILDRVSGDSTPSAMAMNISLLVVGLPYWFGLLYGMWLQFWRKKEVTT